MSGLPLLCPAIDVAKGFKVNVANYNVPGQQWVVYPNTEKKGVPVTDASYQAALADTTNYVKISGLMDNNVQGIGNYPAISCYVSTPTGDRIAIGGVPLPNCAPKCDPGPCSINGKPLSGSWVDCDSNGYNNCPITCAKPMSR